MPNHVVPANAGGMPKFDRAAVMRRAWQLYNIANRYPGLPAMAFSRRDFAFYLATAWAEAKQAAMTPTARRVDQIKTELARVPYSAARTYQPRRDTLQAELSALTA